MAAYTRLLTKQGPIALVSMGYGSPRLPPSADAVVRDVGRVSEADKLDILSSAIATAQLSKLESFSLVVLESFACATPAIVHADCPVTREHCEESGGGVWVRDAEEFAEALDRLRSDVGLRGRMGEAGHRYALSRYSWSVVTTRLEAALEDLAA
jgi:glycosyltransferase involved in cell wall biosynthesis